MVHGFPESWYSWRHQMGPVAQAGFTAAAIDVRGYGGSDKPHAVDGLCDGAADRRHGRGGQGAAARCAGDPDRPRLGRADGVEHGALPARAASARWRRCRCRTPACRPGRSPRCSRRPSPTRAASSTRPGSRRWGRRRPRPRATSATSCASSTSASRATRRTAHGRRRRTGATHAGGDGRSRAFPAWLTRRTSTITWPSSRASGFFGPISRYRNHERDLAWLQQFADRRIEPPALLIGGDEDPAFNGFGRVADPCG